VSVLLAKVLLAKVPARERVPVLAQEPVLGLESVPVLAFPWHSR
jgi:hypothetical protein